MLSYGAVLTRNGPLCNSTIGLTTREGYLQRHVSSLIKKRSLCTNGLSKKSHSIAVGLITTRSLDTSSLCHKAYQYTKATRNFHTNLIARCGSPMNDVDVMKSETVKKPPRVTPLNYESLLNDKNENDAPSGSWYADTDAPKVEDNKKVEGHHHHAKSSKLTLKDIEKIYPSPKQKLHEIYAIVTVELKKPTLFIDFKKLQAKQQTWSCTIAVNWPEKMQFTANASNKGSASSAAALKGLLWLEHQRKLKKGLPIIYDSNEIENMMNSPVTISINKNTLTDAKMLLEKYDDNIRDLVENNVDMNCFEHQGFQSGAIVDPVGKSNPANRHPEKIAERNELLKRRLEHRMLDYTSDLPIIHFKEKIIEEIANNQVLLIKGDTGCGKTTQVPQYIMDSFAERGEATNCNMIVSQPRRISAISLAERIAAERKEQVGDVVGYQVRLSQEPPNTPAGICFCTTGLLLRKLQFNPTLEGCSHVIVDEAHERTVNTDMLLVLLKRALQKNPKLKVIVMSATINAELFQNYFNCGVIEVPGRTFPVDMNFMEDIDQLNLHTHNRWDQTFNVENVEGGPVTDIEKMGALISWISRNKPPGAILCFLPGWSEITKMRRYLEEYAYMSKHETMIVPVHSKMSNYDQRKIFSKPPPRVRKIVLATDIAETGITVADVVYVVDSCTHRQMRWDEKRGFSSIENQWASKANIMQRKGRAGRVKAGVSYHFISAAKFETLPPYPTPEVMRISLEKTVLDAKTYSHELANDFLGAMPEPPGNRVIAQAVKDLVNLGALDTEENLTPLGKRISLFTIHPKLSKALVYSTIFQCLSPMITIASLMSAESEIFSGLLYDKGAMRNVKSHYHPTSDHVSMAWLFQQWMSFDKVSREDSRQFALKSKLHPDRMFTLSKVRELNAEHMVYANLLPDSQNFDSMDMKENEYAELDELVRGVLLSGMDQVLYMRDFDMRKGRVKKGLHTFIMEDGNRATITPESVNFKRKLWPSPYLTYVRRTHSEERRTSLIRETSMISPLTTFLFSQTRVFGFHDEGNTAIKSDDTQMIILTMKGRKNIKMICDKNTADVILRFRDSMWSVIRYLTANYGVVSSENVHDYEQINEYKIEMLQVLAKMLAEASESIDEPGSTKDGDRKVDEEEDEEGV